MKHRGVFSFNVYQMYMISFWFLGLRFVSFHYVNMCLEEKERKRERTLVSSIYLSDIIG